MSKVNKAYKIIRTIDKHVKINTYLNKNIEHLIRKSLSLFKKLVMNFFNSKLHERYNCSISSFKYFIIAI